MSGPAPWACPLRRARKYRSEAARLRIHAAFDMAEGLAVLCQGRVTETVEMTCRASLKIRTAVWLEAEAEAMEEAQKPPPL